MSGSENADRIYSPFGDLLFPQPRRETDGRFPNDILLTITPEDVRDVTHDHLDRDLTDAEFNAVLSEFEKCLDLMDWTHYVEEAIQVRQEAGLIEIDKERP